MITVKVKLFASFKDSLGESEFAVQLIPAQKVKHLCELLSLKGDSWEYVFGRSSQVVKIALNQEMVEIDATLKDGDEVAFFPPVTGG